MLASSPSSETDPRLESALGELHRLRQFDGPPAEFWAALTPSLGRLVQAQRVLLILRDPAAPDRLRKLGEWAADGSADRAVMAFNRSLPALVAQVASNRSAVLPLDEDRTTPGPATAVGVSLQFQGGQEQCVAAVLLPTASASQCQEALLRLQLASDVPLAYQTHQAARQAAQDVEKFASVLDVLVLFNSETRFRAATLALCNGVATRFQCERVSLGWEERGFVRLKAISRTERFDKHMAAVQAIERTMEEALDQDEEIVWPRPEGCSLVTRDHERFAQEQSVAHLASVPVRLGDKLLGVLTCERQARPFTSLEVQQLRLVADQAARRLSELRRWDRWFGARWAAQVREVARKAVGPRHTWLKVLSLVGTAALVALCLPIYPYRVEGNFLLRSEEVSFLTAPFDGYIRNSTARPGDEMPAGSVLLELNTEELELQQAAAIADHTRYLREAEKARAARQLAEMRIAQAQADQVQAQLDLIRYRLEQARIRAPFASVVVEGDLRQRIGAPVRQGDALFRLARIDTLYVEAQLHERDVHEILNRTDGEVAFVSQPRLKYPIRVVRIEPAGVPKENANLFTVRCAFVDPPQTWWRPGMSGVVKLDVERRTLAWILTHRTVDFLRLLLWW
ncbi:MAG TPA: HlyD family efflux transporter periplasmic adaptor subunit [Verrucomicrobiota bacterium]|nr:HlyD family efflux transporter periplasmic adaptor subunit [Verrucomicrobiota bacterium]HNU50446.1 HlyD family efflux transporter periplasmic adaptor subunit [Verrucomicrobiota bacterium]